MKIDLHPVSKSNEQMILNPDANKLMDDFSRLTDAKKNKARSWPVRNLINLRTGLRRFLITKRLDLPSLIEYMTKIPGKMFEGEFSEITSDLVDQVGTGGIAPQQDARIAPRSLTWIGSFNPVPDAGARRRVPLSNLQS